GVEQETLEAVPSDPEEEQAAGRPLEPTADEVDDTEQDCRPQQVVDGDVVVDARSARPHRSGDRVDRRYGTQSVGQSLVAGALEDVVLGSQVVSGFDAIPPGGRGRAAEMLDDGEVPQPAHHRPDGESEAGRIQCG